MLLHNQPGFLAELQGDVVSRDKEVLPANTGPTGRMQKRSAIHVSGRDLSQLFSRPQSLCEVSHLPARDESIGRIRWQSPRSNTILHVRSAASISAFLLRSDVCRYPIADFCELQILTLQQKRLHASIFHLLSICQSIIFLHLRSSRLLHFTYVICNSDSVIL